MNKKVNSLLKISSKTALRGITAAKCKAAPDCKTTAKCNAVKNSEIAAKCRAAKNGKGALAAAARELPKAAAAAAASVVVPGAVYLPLVMREAVKKHNDKCDYLLILGCRVTGADTPSEQLKERMERAAEYLKENESTIAVPCGGCFRKGQTKSEAAIITEYLVKNNIAPGRILPEDRSETTFENFENAAKIIEAHSGKKINDLKIAFLTSDYHIFRAASIARACGIASPGRVSCKTGDKAVISLLREYPAACELLLRKAAKRLSGGAFSVRRNG